VYPSEFMAEIARTKSFAFIPGSLPVVTLHPVPTTLSPPPAQAQEAVAPSFGLMAYILPTAELPLVIVTLKLPDSDPVAVFTNTVALAVPRSELAPSCASSPPACV